MSKTKRALPEDIDLTDPRDGMPNPAEEAYLAQQEPPATVWAMVDLQRASKTLLENARELTVGDIQDLTSIMEDLQGIVSTLKKPF